MKRKDLFIQISGWLVLFLIIISPAILSAKSIYGNGNQVTLKEDFTNFDQVEISHAFDARINYGKDYEIVIRVDENLKDYVTIEKKGNILKIGMKNGYSYIDSHLEAAITLPDIKGLGLSGASSVVINGFKMKHDFDLDLSGASKVFGNLETGNLDMDISGASDVTLKGCGENLEINASGSSSIKMEDYTVNDARLELSGASSCLINFDGTMDVQASGSSKVKYCGDGTLGSIESSGFSKIKRI